MNVEELHKTISPYVVNSEMTWDNFDKIFGFLPKKEQYLICDAIQDELKISLVEETLDVEEISKAVSPYVFRESLTWDNFDKIFGALPLREQYVIADVIELNLKISIVDEINSAEISPLIHRAANEIRASNKILIKLIQSGDEQARQDLCVKNRGLVDKFADYYFKKFPCSLELEDLVQEGNIGMLKAAEKFDCLKGYEFSTYATQWIVQSITRAIVDTGQIIRLPVHVVEKILKASRLERNFLIEGFDLRRRIELVAREMATTPEEISRLFSLRAIYLNITSLDKPIDEENDSFLRDFIEDKNTPDPAEIASLTILKDQLDQVLNTLTERERDVLKLRYGLDDGRESTLEEVGKIFGVTRERIRQIEAQALRKLRHPTRSKKLKDFLE
ncbi:MAG: sigma-70 family RNA polymerase sigma factor [Selenomonadaceae bacterium]|nr:sigma-70 family RNA polymerase sigma factor [Selenomonadaceae bacterium]